MTKQGIPQRGLEAIGLDHELVEAVMGDLAEDFARRSREHGVLLARAWYAREVLRSAPHLYAMAIRRGGPRARMLLATTFGATALIVVATVAFMQLRDGPPVRLVSALADATDVVLLNNTRPVKLPMQALDHRGHALESGNVRYVWSAGDALDVSAAGVVTCTQRADAVVTASLGDITRKVAVRCRPVKEMQATSWVDLIAGGDARDVQFVATGVDDRPVSELRGMLRMRDSTIAALKGVTVKPLAVGSTPLEITVGDRRTELQVIVHELVSSFVGLRAGQHYAAIAVRLAQGDTLRWALPVGAYWLKFIPLHPGGGTPTIALQGRVGCGLPEGLRIYRLPTDVYATYCSNDGEGAVDLAHGMRGPAVVEGYLAIDRVLFR